jgi:hypothetical protein
MKDITIIYYTLNRCPKGWAKFHMEHLLKAIGDSQVISVSREPMQFGFNLVDVEKPCYTNIYRQLLRAAKYAKTKYVATAEDDVLYSNEHFREFRPKDDEFSYNRSRWSVFAWEGDKAMYCLRNRVSNCSLIAPTALLIEALEERFAKTDLPDHLMGECGRNKLEQRLGLTLRKMVEWWSTCPIIHLNHRDGTDGRQAATAKLHGQLKAYDIPFWGKAVDIARRYAD